MARISASIFACAIGIMALLASMPHAFAQIAAPEIGASADATSAALPTAESADGEAPGIVKLLHDRLRQMIVNVPTVLSHLNNTATGIDGNAGSPEGAVLLALLSSVIAVLAGEIVARLLSRVWLRGYPDTPESRIQRLCFLATQTITGIAAAITIVVVGFVANNYLSGHDHNTYMTIMIAILGIATFRALIATAKGVISPFRAAYRPVSLTDRQSHSLYYSLLVTMLVCTVALSCSIWVNQLPLHRDVFRLVHILATFVAMLALAILVLRQRLTIASALATSSNNRPRPWRKVLAGSWHIIALIYLGIAWVVSCARVLLDLPGGIGLVSSPLVILIAAAAVYGLALICIDALFRNTEHAPVMDLNGDPLPTFQDLIEHAAGIVVAIAAFSALFSIWGVALFDITPTFGMRFFEEIIIVLVAYLAYQATKIVMDRKLLAEYRPADDAHPSSTSSRLGTLLHLLRGFTLSAIVVMAGMAALSELGIDIAPLFAGAGVIGLAVGFGSQTLIRDMFSGAFFLIDDAFRRGEYIDIGVAKGTVERISVRSLQLRHQNGPLFTVPFGDIKHIENFSRDWVVMKFPLRLVWGTDVNKVKKIIKQISQELQDDPVIGPKLMEPLKSQGIYKMDDSGIIVRTKFKTRPGDQFAVRGAVYAKITQQFALNDIHFSSREVMVRVAQGDVTPREISLAAGAAIALRSEGEV